MQVRRLAELVVGPAAAARVQVRTGPATRHALAEAGRPAVTVGNVIHMESGPDRSARSAEILAHELVHATSPSPVPRFFDDDHRSREEIQARRTGTRVAALLHTFERRIDAGTAEGGRARHLTLGTAGLAVGPGASPLTAGALGQTLAGSGSAGGPAGPPAGGESHSARRNRRPGRHRPGGPGTGGSASGGGWNATDLDGGGGPPAEWIDGLPQAVADIVRRGRPGPQPGPGPSAGPGGSPGQDLFSGSGSSGSAASGAGSDPDRNPLPFNRNAPRGIMRPNPISSSDPEVPYVDRPGAPVSAETIDWIVEAVEERVLAELERRGLRFQPGVF